jgi:hypothetical protein
VCARDCERACARERRIHRPDDPVLEDHVGDPDERSRRCSTMSA